jgi:hypothetical protein
MNPWKIVYGIFSIFLSCFASQKAFAQQPYYQNKTIRIIRGGEPGARVTCKRER